MAQVQDHALAGDGGVFGDNWEEVQDKVVEFIT